VPFVLYSLYRVALIVVAAVVLYLVGMRGWLLGVVAVVVALCASYLLLNGPRTRASADIARRREHRKALAAANLVERSEDEAEEDAQVDGDQPR